MKRNNRRQTLSNNNIAHLQAERENLTSENSRLSSNLQEKEETIYAKDSEIENLNYSIENLNNRINSLNSSNSDLQRQLTAAQNKSSSSSSSSGTYYKVNVSQAYCYRLCAGTYYKNDCYYSSGAVVEVYTQRDGYGLTIGGYLQMSELTRY